MKSRAVRIVAAPMCLALTLQSCASGAGEPSGTATVAATPIASDPSVLPSPTRLPAEQPDGQPDLGPFRSATLTVPDWGPTAGSGCSEGWITLTDGGQESNDQHRPVNVLSYVAVDVDHDGAKDYVAHLMCGEGPEAGGSQVVAYRLDGRELRPIGRIVGTQDGFAMMDHIEARSGGRVAVLVAKEYTDGGEETVPNQWRTYAWRQGRFRQVDGPTTFPAKSPAARLSVVPSVLTFRQIGSGFAGRMTVAVSNDGDVDVARLEIRLILPGQVQPAGADWAGCTTGPEETTFVCVVAGPRARSRISMPFTFVASDKPVPVDDEVGNGNHQVWITQRPPFGGQVLINDPDALIPITLP
ncbi:hypothetical protein ACQPZX_14565 [Actinoplanes sp. CA-142083]|uniref:hypothetical protein n=1 Tax=Actinoplanes sp. CA-142083 TaxID=3239903 RepID=UPI003D931CC1